MSIESKTLSLTPEEPTGAPSRREFCLHAVSLAGLASLVQACGGGSPTSPSNAPQLTIISGTVSSGTITVNVDAGSPLANVGGAALLSTSSGLFLVSRTAQDTFVALTATCTHEGCNVSGFQNNNYVCPCHGSEFNTSGGVVKGPATSSLRRFNTTFANNVLTITL